MQKQYSLGFISHSRANKERRVPIWWEHLTCDHLKHPLLKEYIFEENFGLSAFRESADAHLTHLGFKVVDRAKVLNLSDIVISLKPTDEWMHMQPGSTLVGWFNHLESLPQDSSEVQFLNLEDIAIFAEGRQQKLLYRNADVAGECGVAQTLEMLEQIDPLSPAIAARERFAVVLGYGNLGQGAVTELLRQGIEHIVVFTQRHPTEVENKIPEVDYRQMRYGLNNTYTVSPGGLEPSLMADILWDADIIVNATLPSSNQPSWTFIPDPDFTRLKQNMAYIDPVHKVGHGTSFAQVTKLTEPLKQIARLNHSIWYNGCNAMPSYRPAYASFVISQSITAYLDDFLKAVEKSSKVLL